VAWLRPRGIALLSTGAALLMVYFMRAWWLAALGGFLVQADAPAPADLAVVLGGDFYGHRIVKGAELVRQGLARKVLVSGGANCYGARESELAINFAVKHGFPPDYFLAVSPPAHSTAEEAQLVVDELRRLKARSFLLVTSDYHTRRAGREFRRLVQGLEMRVVAAPDEYFRADSWWRNRQGQKIVFLEWTKTVTSLAGL